MQRYFILLSSLLFYPFSIYAVCQETDEHGNVSYVDCARAETEEATPVEIQPINTANPKEFIPHSGGHSTTSSNSSAKQKKQDYADKQKELESAKKTLEQAREVGEGDRQGTATGGSRLTEQYLKRVKAAEERVKTAEEKLK